METTCWPLDVRAVCSDDNGDPPACLLFIESESGLVQVCFDRQNSHVVDRLRGEVEVLSRALGITRRSLDGPDPEEQTR